MSLEHGERRIHTLRAGAQRFDRREIYCETHGWVDMFFVGDLEGFQLKHGRCRDRKEDLDVRPLTERMTMTAIWPD